MRQTIVRSGRTLAAAALVTLSIAGVASAQVTSINYTRTFGSPDNRVILQFSTTLSGVADIELDNYAGSQNLELSNFSPTSTIGYCIHIGGVLGTNPTVPYTANIRKMSELVPGDPFATANAVRGQGAAWLFNNTTVNNNRDSAALQLAIWEALYDWNGTAFASFVDGNINLAPGGGNHAYKHTPALGASDIFTEADAAVTADIRARANNMLTAWGGQLSDATWLDTDDVTGPSQPPVGRIRQDLITITNQQVAPEPGTLGFLFAGIGALAIIRRRK